MAEDWEKLERQLDREAEALADLWPVACPTDLRDRLREAVRLELNTKCLPGQSAPTPDPSVLDRTRRAVRRELAASVSPGRRGTQAATRWVWATSGIAAAVALVVAGVLWYGERAEVTSESTTDRDATLVRASDRDPVELFAQAAQQVWTQDPLVGELRSDVQALEEQVVRGSGEDSVEQLIEQIDGQIEEMFDQWPSISGDNA